MVPGLGEGGNGYAWRALRALRASAAALLTLLVLTACGGSGNHYPDVAKLPLLSGTQIVVQAHECDPGASAFCAVELVVVDKDFDTSADLLLAERAYLHAHGWTGAGGDTGDESAADSPDHKLRVTYATPGGDLKAGAFNQIKRPQAVVLGLSRAIFNRQAALSVLLEDGPGAT